jgi:predicted membrane chloride channel (bestrophin family)
MAICLNASIFKYVQFYLVFVFSVATTGLPGPYNFWRVACEALALAVVLALHRISTRERSPFTDTIFSVIFVSMTVFLVFSETSIHRRV